MLVAPVGIVGSGKGLVGVYTVDKARLGEYNRLLGIKDVVPYHVYTNYRYTPLEETNKPGGNLDPLELVNMVQANKIPDHSVISFHEAHRFMDSWNTMRLRDEARTNRMEFDYIVDESRKRDFILIFDTQDDGKLDNRVRDSFSYKVNCMNFANNPVKDPPRCIFEIIKDPSIKNHLMPEPFWHRFFIPRRKWYQKLYPLYDTKEKGGFWLSEIQRSSYRPYVPPDPMKGLVASK